VLSVREVTATRPANESSKLISIAPVACCFPKTLRTTSTVCALERGPSVNGYEVDAPLASWNVSVKSSAFVVAL